MRKIVVLFFIFVLMFGLVAGAGYKVTVPGGGDGTTTGGGGGGTTVNETANDTTVSGDVSDDDSGDKGVVSKGVDKIVDVVKGLGWEVVVIVLAVLGVIGGASWYVLKDKRKKFVEDRAKKK